jgi:hypothetical protein
VVCSFVAQENHSAQQFVNALAITSPSDERHPVAASSYTPKRPLLTSPFRLQHLHGFYIACETNR